MKWKEFRIVRDPSLDFVYRVERRCLFFGWREIQTFTSENAVEQARCFILRKGGPDVITQTIHTKMHAIK
jgi:hypothetical protein